MSALIASLDCRWTHTNHVFVLRMVQGLEITKCWSPEQEYFYPDALCWPALGFLLLSPLQTPAATECLLSLYHRIRMVVQGHPTKPPSPSFPSLFRLLMGFPDNFWISTVMEIPQDIWQPALKHFHGDFLHVNKNMKFPLLQIVTGTCLFVDHGYESSSSVLSIALH